MGKEYRVKCHKLDNTGKGMVTFNHSTFSIPYLLEGETASIALERRPKSTTATLVSVETPSIHRIKPKCPIFFKCGGCDFQHMSYEHQLLVKKSMVEELFSTYGNVQDVIGMEHPYYYRNKIHQTLSKDKRGTIISGIYEEDTHHVIDTKKCYIQDSCADQIMTSIKSIMKQQRIEPFDEDKKRGTLRHVLIKHAQSTNQTMVVLVAGTTIFPGKKNFVDALKKAHPEITTIILNINQKKTSMVLGEKESILFGKGYIEDILCGRTFCISPKSFYQVNPIQTKQLYEAAIHSANLTGGERVLDAYSGIGTISLIVSDKVKEVIGVEINKDAVSDAKENAKRNGVTNVSFVCEDASPFMMKQASKQTKFDVVFVDPPRSGCDVVFLKSVTTLKPAKIVYISCNPETQKRDVDYLKEQGYQVTYIQPVDMFPWTKHVENIITLVL